MSAFRHAAVPPNHARRAAGPIWPTVFWLQGTQGFHHRLQLHRIALEHDFLYRHALHQRAVKGKYDSGS
jgi:hypothetical protein